MTAQKQHELIAIEGDVKKETKRVQTDIYHTLQKPDLFFGMEKTYAPFSENEENLPPENKRVQAAVDDLFKEFSKVTTHWLDVMASKDASNQRAKADLVVDGEVLVKDVPVLALLGLETELEHIKAVASATPTLPLDEEWLKNEATDQYFTKPIQTQRKKKVMKVLVHFEPTKEHPGKSESYGEDLPVGTWTVKRISTAWPARRKQELLERITKLLHAVKKARERANSLEATEMALGAAVTKYLFQ